MHFLARNSVIQKKCTYICALLIHALIPFTTRAAAAYCIMNLTAYPTHIWLALLLYWLVAIILSLAANHFFLRWLTNLGVNAPARQADNNNIIRWVSQTKPTVGGLGFYAVFVAASIAAWVWVWRKGEPLTDLLFEFLPIFAAVTLGFLLGLIDDLRHTSPAVKFAGQFACAFLLLLGGVCIPTAGSYWLGAVLSIVWVVGLMNAINMLDNMDGITATVSAAILLAVTLILVMMGLLTSFYCILTMGVLAGIMGFLYFNWQPARMYMGDSGSQFLGVFLSVVSIKYLWSFGADASANSFSLQQFVLPALAFLLPLTDTTTVFVRRLARGQSPFVGGRDHTTHHLAYCGLTDRQVGYLFAFMSLVLVLVVCAAAHAMLHHRWTNKWSYGCIAVCALFFGAMQWAYQRGKQRQLRK